MRPAYLIALLTLVLATPAAAGAQTATPHVVASANGASATSSANEGEIQECSAQGCQFALTAPARPPATWNGEVPSSAGTAIELVFARPVRVLGAYVVDRAFKPLASATVERGDDRHWRVVLPARTLPERSALRVLESWEGEDERAQYSVSRTDFIGLVAPASLLGIAQKPGGGAVFDLDAHAMGRVDARLSFGKKTLGTRSLQIASPRRLAVSVPLSAGARRLLRARRRIKATLTVTAFPASGGPVQLERRVTLRAKPR